MIVITRVVLYTPRRCPSGRVSRESTPSELTASIELHSTPLPEPAGQHGRAAPKHRVASHALTLDTGWFSGSISTTEITSLPGLGVEGSQVAKYIGRRKGTECSGVMPLCDSSFNRSREKTLERQRVL
jgi:hypothetical protein